MYKVYVTNGVTELYATYAISLHTAVDKLEQLAMKYQGCTIALKYE